MSSENLIPMDQRSEAEARELGAKGGKASGAARRRKRSLKEAADLYLSLPVSDRRRWNPNLDKAVAHRKQMDEFLTQDTDRSYRFEETVRLLQQAVEE